MTLRIQALCIDSHNPSAIATFWEAALGWRRTYEHDLVILLMPEEKVVKNRLHLDLRPDDQAAEVRRLIDLGAREVSVGQSPDVSWVVLADPDGNEFCVLSARSD